MTKDEIIKRYVEAVTIATTSIARKIVMPCEYDDVVRRRIRCRINLLKDGEAKTPYVIKTTLRNLNAIYTLGDDIVTIGKLQLAMTPYITPNGLSTYPVALGYIFGKTETIDDVEVAMEWLRINGGCL